MNENVPPHEKVRFRRDEIKALESLPSSYVPDRKPQRRGRSNVWLRSLLLIVAATVLLAATGAGTLYLAGAAGLGSDRLKREAETALGALTGKPVEVTAGPARFSLGGSRRIGLEIPDVRIAMAGDTGEGTRAGKLRFGFSLWPLLTGKLEVTRIALADARLATSMLPARGDGGWTTSITNPRGLIEPDLVIESVFSGLERMFAMFEGRSVPRVSLDNVEIVLGEGASLRSIVIESAEARRIDDGSLEILAKLTGDNRVIELSGNADHLARDAGLRFSIAAELGRPVRTEETSGGADAPKSKAPLFDGDVSLTIAGSASEDGAPATIRVALKAQDAVLSMPDMQQLRLGADISATLVEGTGKIEFERVDVVSRRSRYAFHGAIGPLPENDRTEARGYRWEFISDRSIVATADAPEPGLQFIARLAGTFHPEKRLLSASEIGVRTGRGELLGRATLQFPAGEAPAIALAVDVPSMPVSHAKQLWPADAAPGARSWVLSNVFGGTVKNSRIRFRVDAGRLGNGIALSGDEVNGHFEIDDTRFDITGDLPPVRDAFGEVDFRGSDVDVGLSSGVVYMPTGRTLVARDGTFLIRNVESQPSVGYMDIDVEGDASSAVEFASYRPINAMRHLNLLPEEFSGEVTGNVKADIPLRRDFPIEDLNWSVDLDYSDLAIAKPFEGQEVTEARGSIEVDPEKAIIEADAKLNGVSAKIRMTEPLGEAGPARERDVTLQLDDAGREKIAPGLNTMLSGPVSVAVSIENSGAQRMEADLTDAQFDLPWVGWSKGPGIPASASFLMEPEGDDFRLSDFRLSGKSFSAEGEIRLAGGSLAEARFDKVALNRGDDFAFAIKTAGKGYSIKIDGKALDARSAIKLYLANTEQAEEAVESVPISLDANVATVTGFGSEALSGVTMSLGGEGTDLGTLRIAATAKSGAKVDIVNDSDAGGRSVSIKSADAGAVLRFLNIYEYMQGGTIDIALAARGNGPLKGQIEARDFWIVNEPKLRSLVATAPPEGDGRSLAQAVRRDIDTSKAKFERGFAVVEKGDKYLAIERGVLRGPLIGATFQGALYDPKGNMSVTGTFMPAYGLNRLFAEIPLFGQILGNGRDRGLIGITFKLAGDAKEPQLQVNPISVIAPGIFRSIFEFN